MIASFEGHTMLANVPFCKQKHDSEILLHMSVGLPGPLRTLFEPTN